MTHEESSEWDLSENESDFESSESEEESFDDDRVYGFPNDRDGSAFNVVAKEESSQNDETDSQGSGFSDEEENNIDDDVIEIAFVDVEDPEIRVARHNINCNYANSRGCCSTWTTSPITEANRETEAC